MNFSRQDSRKQINKILQDNLEYPLYTKNRIELQAIKKKEKRNRKFFLKYSVLLVSICQQTGNIDFQTDSDFIHIEIMQGGHQPLNIQGRKEIKQLIFNNDQDCKLSNVENTLKLASNWLAKRAQKEFGSTCHSQGFQTHSSNQKQKQEATDFLNSNFFLREQQIPTERIQNSIPCIYQSISEAKNKLNSQYQTILQMLV